MQERQGVMDKYKELVRKYREFADDMQRSDRGHDKLNADLLYEAADAIEELTIELQAMRNAANGFKRMYYSAIDENGSLKVNECACGTAPDDYDVDGCKYQKKNCRKQCAN